MNKNGSEMRKKGKAILYDGEKKENEGRVVTAI
jgi:hypothetical protein